MEMILMIATCRIIGIPLFFFRVTITSAAVCRRRQRHGRRGRRGGLHVLQCGHGGVLKGGAYGEAFLSGDYVTVDARATAQEGVSKDGDGVVP